MSLPKIGEYIFAGSAFAVALIAYVITSGKIADHDPFVMGEVAQRLAEGKSLYLEAWDNKPPLALLFYYPSQAVAPHSYLGQQVFTFCWTAASALAIFFLLRGEKSWIRVVIATIVLWTPLSRTDFAWGSSEDAANGFTILLAVLGYRVLRDGRIGSVLWFVCGMAAGFALHTRQSAVIFLGFPIAALLISPQLRYAKIRAFALIIFGCALAFAIVIGIMLVVSDWPSYLDIMVNKPMQYSGVKDIISTGQRIDVSGEYSGDGLSLLPGFTTMLVEKLHVFRSVLLEHFQRLGMDILLVIPVLAIFLNSGRRWRMMALLLVCIGIAAVLLPMKLFSHYHQQLIPTFAIGTLFLLRRFDEVSPHLAKSLAVGLLGIMFFKVAITAEELRYDNGEQAEMGKVVQIIESESREEDRLFAVGKNSAYIYYLSTMEPCHKIHWEIFFGWLSAYLPMNVETVMDSIVAKPPNWIAIDRDALEKFVIHPNEAEEGVVRTGKLLRRLNEKNTYESAHEVGRWHILQRMNQHDAKARW